MKTIKFLIALAAVACLTSCGSKPEWNTLRDGNLYYGKIDSSKEYYWEGNTVGKLPDGEGVLVVLKSNGKVAKKINMIMYYGTDESKYPYPAIEGGKYLGESKIKKGMAVPQGFGVLIQEGDIVSYGTFKKGELEGQDAVVCQNKEVIYKGGMFNGLKEGQGEEYHNGKLFYKGSWKKGQKNGNGTMYDEDGSAVYNGNWTNDQAGNWEKIK